MGVVGVTYWQRDPRYVVYCCRGERKRRASGLRAFGELVTAETWMRRVSRAPRVCLNCWCKCCEVVCEVEGLWCDVVWCLWLTNSYVTMSRSCFSMHQEHTHFMRGLVFLVWCGLMWMADKFLCYHVIWLPLVRQEHTHTHTFHTFAEGEKKQYLFGHSSSELKIAV